nr:MFS transporter [Phytoactinopolyspora alkaliphila]
MSYGILFYAFPVLLTEISADTGWSRAALTGAFSAGLLVAAAVGVPLGHRLDRHGPRWLMTAGSLLGGPSLVVVALAPSLAVFMIGWVLAGLAMAALFYPPAFTAVTRWYGSQRVKALTLLTLAAGFASTVFAPLTAWLLDQIGWQSTYLLLAIGLSLVTAPAHWWGLRGPWPESTAAVIPSTEASAAAPPAAEPGRITRSLSFVATTLAVSLASFTAYAVVINLVPLLVEQGMDTGQAAVALGLGGVGQVAGRVAYPAMTRRLSVRTRTTVILLATALTTVALGLVTVAMALIAASVVAGMARGLLTLVQATAVSERWGVAHYGKLTGLLSAPVTVTVALAPWAGAAIAGLTGSYASAFLVLAGIGLVSVAFALVSVPLTRTRAGTRVKDGHRRAAG